MKILSRSMGFVAMAALATTIAACSPAAPAAPAAPSGAGKEGANTASQWEQTVQAAKKDGSVVVVTHTNLLYRELVERFKEKYPDIGVEHVAIRPSEFSPKVITEQQNGIFGYDLWISPTSNMVEVVLPTGGMEKLTPYLLQPEVVDTKNWRGGQLFWATKEPYILLNRGNVSGSVWVNRDLLPASEFSKVEQIIDQKFKGKIQVRTPDAPHGGSLTMTGWLHNRGEDFVWKVLKDQDPVYIENARLLTQNLITGKYPLAIGTDNATIDNCKQAGACTNLEEIRLPEYLLGHGVAMLKKAPHPNAGAVFLNWFFSKEGQEAFKQSIITTEPTGQDAHSVHVAVEPHPDAVAMGAVPDYTKLSQYSLQGMEQGAEEMQRVLALYRKVQAGESR